MAVTETTDVRERDRIIAAGGKLVRVVVDGGGNGIPLWVVRRPA